MSKWISYGPVPFRVMPRENARRLCLECLMARGGPPKNALAEQPAIARYLSSYNLCKSLTCLPAAGGLDDQEARWVSLAIAFSGAEAEHSKNQERSGR